MEYICLYFLVIIIGIIYLNKNNINIIRLIFLILILFSGCRYYIGVDYPMYMKIFFFIKNNINDYEVLRLEKGYYFLVKFIVSINGTQQLTFLVIAFFTNYLIYKNIKKESSDILMSTLIYFLVGAYYSAGFNLIRQVMAISIFFYSIIFIKQKKIIKYFLFIIVGSLFHKSCIVLLPLYWILNLKYNRFIKIVLISITVSFNFLLPKVYEILGYGQYTILEYEATTSFITLSLFFILALLIEIFSNIIFLDNVSKNINFFTILLVLSIFLNEKNFPTMNQVFIRMSSYFTFYYIILIPQLLGYLTKKYSKVIKFLFFICISILYFKTFLLQLPTYKYNFILFEF